MRLIKYVLSFIIPIFIFLLGLYIMDLYPFGKVSFRITDAFSQYPAFFEGLKDFNLYSL